MDDLQEELMETEEDTEAEKDYDLDWEVLEDELISLTTVSSS